MGLTISEFRKKLEELCALGIDNSMYVLTTKNSLELYVIVLKLNIIKI